MQTFQVAQFPNFAIFTRPTLAICELAGLMYEKWVLPSTYYIKRNLCNNYLYKWSVIKIYIWATSENTPSNICAQQRFRSVRTFAVWSESSLGIICIANDATFLHADNGLWSDYMDAQADSSLR